MKQLYFCRHGQSELNAANKYTGRLDTPLTELGREQARQAGELAKHLAIDMIIASPLGRTRETAELIAEAIDYPKDGITFDEVFIERSYGTLEGLPWDTENNGQFTGIETQQELAARAAAALEVLRALEADTVLLVGHGATGLAIMHALGMSVEAEPLNATILELL